ncbi:MAG: BLUF domain-containing protein [Candidatus Sericytochromatia bacterium]
MLYKLIYSSRENIKFTDDVLKAILDKANKHNSKNDITGVFLYIDGNIIQLLEGEKDDIEALFERISKDNRHKNIKVLIKGSAEERTFPEWYMGFKSMNYSDYSEYLKKINYLHDISPTIVFSQENSLDLLVKIIKSKA